MGLVLGRAGSAAEKKAPKPKETPKETPEEAAERKEAAAEQRRLAGEKRRRSREEFRDNQRKVMRACANEIGFFCNNVRKSTWKSIKCLKRREADLLPYCLKSLEALKKK